MTIADFIVIGIIFAFTVIGTARGLMSTLFKFVSYILAIFLSFKFAKPLSIWLRDSSIHTRLQTMIAKVLEGMNINPGRSAGTTPLYDSVQNLPLPENITKALADSVSAGSTTASEISAAFISQLTDIIMVILCAIVIFIILRIVFFFFGHVVEGIAKIPLIKQVDRLGGMVLGIGVGFLMVFILLLVAAFVLSIREVPWLSESIENGIISSYLYNNNLIANLFNIGKGALS
ncbi:MAG: CvpA family protein [Clostridia bacterium]